MKITKTQLKRIIREELDTALGQEDNSPPQVDIINALDMANRMEASGDMAELRYVIEALESALEKLGGQEEEEEEIRRDGIPVRHMKDYAGFSVERGENPMENQGRARKKSGDCS
jgi:hypothetical protein|tara:strand:+ start:42 stop:386 length:345 start_codon:yes stop_codon:yes gene_type:complete